MRMLTTVAAIVSIAILAPLFTQAQFVLRGKLVDSETRLPIPSVNVFIRGEKTGTTTDSAGSFGLFVPFNREVTVVFSHVAYRKLTWSVRLTSPPQKEYHLPLIPEPVRYQEFVVWGVKPIPFSDAARKRALITLSDDDFEHLGEPDMDKALQYFLPDRIKPYTTRMMKPEDDFTFYVNGEWKESIHIKDIDPYDVRRVIVWEMLGPKKSIDSLGRDAASDENVDVSPIQMPLRRGKLVVSVEKMQ